VVRGPVISVQWGTNNTHENPHRREVAVREGGSKSRKEARARSGKSYQEPPRNTRGSDPARLRVFRVAVLVGAPLLTRCPRDPRSRTATHPVGTVPPPWSAPDRTSPASAARLVDVGVAGAVALPPRVLPPILATRRLLPLPLRRQAYLVAHLRTQPAAVRHRVVPRHRLTRAVRLRPVSGAGRRLPLGKPIPPPVVLVATRIDERLELRVRHRVPRQPERGQFAAFAILAVKERPARHLHPRDVGQPALVQSYSGTIVQTEVSQRGGYRVPRLRPGLTYGIDTWPPASLQIRPLRGRGRRAAALLEALPAARRAARRAASRSRVRDPAR
jgi:hypothetical protein